MYQVYTINGEIIDINSIIKYEVEKQLQLQINNIINQILLSSNKNPKLSGRKPKVTIEDIEEVKRLYKNGYSYTKIRNITGWSKGTISNIIKGKYDCDDMSSKDLLNNININSFNIPLNKFINTNNENNFFLEKTYENEFFKTNINHSMDYNNNFEKIELMCEACFNEKIKELNNLLK